MRLEIAIASISAFSAAAVESSSALPVIDLGYVVQQATLNNSGTYGLLSFSNIRFGEPPTSTLRFAAPIPPQTTNRTVNDGQQNVICPQAYPTWVFTALELLNPSTTTSTSIVTSKPTTAPSSPPSLSDIVANIPAPEAGTSEDCLFLDVVVPEKIYNSKYGEAQRASQNGTKIDCGDSKGAPILVWIYGGGYVYGSKQLSGNPSTLISKSLEDDQEGIVFVAPNYRLGGFGWQASSEFQAQGGVSNAGLLDQRLALEWIQKYIHLFGGDPSRVTVLGESAGSGSIFHHITAPSSYNTSKLFTKAIAQSPAFQPVINTQETETFEAMLKYASLLSNKTITTLSQMRALPFEVLYSVSFIQVATSSYGTFTFGPVIDGSYVPDYPGRRLLNDSYDHNIQVVAAHNQNEGTLFTSISNQNDTTFLSFVKSLIPYASSETISYVANTLYPPIFNGSYPWTNQMQRAEQINAEFNIVCNSYYLAKTFGPHNAWKYQFSVPPGLHGDDIEYTFFNGDETTQDLGGGIVNADVAGVLQDYIVSFAETGKPSSKGVPRFPDYGDGLGKVLNLNITGLGTVLPDVNDNMRCKYWQEAAWL